MTAAPSPAGRLPAAPLRRRIGSTNDEAKALARAGAAEGTLVWAGEQTAGRGRRGRAWLSPPGNLYLSLVHAARRRRRRAPRSSALSRRSALGEALGALCRASACSCRCKWPNDVLADGRKLAGILLESEMTARRAGRFRRDRRRHQSGLSAERCRIPGHLAGRARISRRRAGSAAASLRPAFRAWAERWRDEGFAPVRAAWLARASRRRRRRFGCGSSATTLTGRFLDLDEDGALLLGMRGEGRRRIAAGEVFPALPAEEAADAARHQRQQHQHRRSRSGTAPI